MMKLLVCVKKTHTENVMYGEIQCETKIGGHMGLPSNVIAFIDYYNGWFLILAKIEIK